jgi:ribosomal protein S18 acetylase RimI-like enzyme
MIDMMKIEYTTTDEQGLDLTNALWQKLIEHHIKRSRYFSGHLARRTFDQRKTDMLEKAKKGRVRIDLAKDVNTGELVGYCISSVSGDGQGEIDSIYIEPDYRGSGIGDNLTKRTLGWMDELSVTKKIVVVGAGNEEVFEFYRRYNFHPRATILEQVETGEKDKNNRVDA